MDEREDMPMPEAPVQDEPPVALPELDSEFLHEDLQTFREKYPDVDLIKLEQQSAFRRFCGSRLYKESAAALYDDYLSVTQEAQQSERARREDRAERSTASGGGDGGSALSSGERAALEQWNAAFPGMRMTAKEFKER